MFSRVLQLHDVEPDRRLLRFKGRPVSGQSSEFRLGIRPATVVFRPVRQVTIDLFDQARGN